jgi:predicted nucleic acid-binding protein
MSVFVIDASATLPWCFEDEATDWTRQLLASLRTSGSAIIPSHWPNEVSNGLLMAFRRSRVPWQVIDGFWNELELLPITIEPPLTPAQAKHILTLAEQYRLTFYDATYLELAQRLARPLATLDDALQRAAPLAGVQLIR